MSADIGTGSAATDQFGTLHAEAKGALAYAANTLRSVTERYRETFHEELAGWHLDRDALDTAERRDRPVVYGAGRSGKGGGPLLGDDPAARAETAAEEARSAELGRQVTLRTATLGERHTELARLELAVRGLERTWLFLERGDASLLDDPTRPDLPDDLQMRIVEAREAERTRLAQEVHDGPAQALANAIFGVEYIEKILNRDRPAAQVELRLLRERLRRELGDVRAFISQLRPPILDEVGLEGAIREAADTFHALSGATVDLDLAASPAALDDAQQVVVLRVLQEALQNARKHAGARRVALVTRHQGDRWALEVRDDGRGFDPDTVLDPGRRTFGLQFMRERAELVRGTFEIRSRPAHGTVVVLDIPVVDRGGSR